MKENIITEVTDVALSIKEAIEDKNPEKLKELFLPNAKVNLFGRFNTVARLISEIKVIMEHIEQPMMDIIKIEESEFKERSAFVTFITENSWIDQRLWEEQSEYGAMSLELNREKKGWLISGLTLSRLPKYDIEASVKFPDLETGAIGRDPTDSGIDALFNIWY
ncbi:MAG: hypothetical protein IH948_00530 [Bacteroidetes bacterium]|nr:hypothetical protein [Bacteroidota bacterium]